MIKEAMQYLLSEARPEIVECEDRPYSTHDLKPLLLPMPKSLQVNTLSGLRDYLESNIDGLELDRLLVHVENARCVYLYHRLTGSFEQRPCFLLATHQQPEFKFGSYMDIEQFVVELQSKIVPDEVAAQILQIVGNITDGTVNTFADDGITQQVTSKSGVGMVKAVPLPNPITLCPRRTFTEIDQPEGRFILRVKAGNGEQRPTVALFEADGGAWQLEAIKRIQKWLRDCIPAEIAVIA